MQAIVNNARFTKVIAICISVSAVLAVSFSLSGCKTPAKMLGKHDKIEAKCKDKPKLQNVGANWCITNYPVSEKTTVKTRYVAGKTITRTDTNTVFKVVKDTVYKTVTVTKWNTRTDIQYIDTSRTIVDTRENDTLKREIVKWIDKASVAEQDRKEAANGRNKWRKWCLITWGVLAVIVTLFFGWKWVIAKWNVFVK